ncbi:MAG: 2TM domain-containing protein [Actinomycetota bacterium]
MPAPPRPSSEPGHDIDEREDAARRYVEHLRAFQVHTSMYALGMLIMFTVNLVTNLSAGIAGEWTAWWSLWALLGWSIGIAVHGLVVWLNRPSFASTTWEQRQLERVLGR